MLDFLHHHKVREAENPEGGFLQGIGDFTQQGSQPGSPMGYVVVTGVNLSMHQASDRQPLEEFPQFS